MDLDATWPRRVPVGRDTHGRRHRRAPATMTTPPHAPLRSLPAGIWALGFVSLLMDASSELVHSLLPVFMASVLRASMITIGLVEGVAEATASIAKVVSGTLSDRLERRKTLMVAGYGLAALSKPLFPLATSVAWVFAARFIDRVGKGIRGAPRDALIADITPSELRGAAYGLRQALDSAGALVGPLLAVILMARFANDIHAVLWTAVLPAVLAVTVLAVAVGEPPRTRDAHTEHVSVTVAELTQLPRRFWGIVSLGAVFTLARFSEAFLLLRAQDVGLAIMYVPAVMVVMNATYAGMAYPAGLAADRLSPRTVLAAGLASLVVADVMLAAAATPVHVFAGAACWGLHMALTQGLFSKLVADEATVRLRGTAFGLYHLVTGVALLVASLVAGALWSTVGPSATFLAGGLFAGIALLGLTRLQPATA